MSSARLGHPSAAGGASLFAEAGDDTALKVAGAVLLLIGTVCAAVVCELKPQANAEAHRSANVPFSTLVGDFRDFAGTAVAAPDYATLARDWDELVGRRKEAIRNAPDTSDRAKKKVAARRASRRRASARRRGEPGGDE